MPRALFLSLAACATALHVQRRALIAPASGSPAPSLRRPHTLASSTLILRRPRPRAARAPRNAAPRRRSSRINCPRSAVWRARCRRSVGPQPRGLAREGLGWHHQDEARARPERARASRAGAGAQGGPVGRRHRRAYEIKYQQKRSFNGKAEDDNSSNGIFKMKRGIGKPLGFSSPPPPV